MVEELTIEQVLAPFEKEDAKGFTEHEISSALRQLVPKDTKEIPMEIMAEAMAFDFCENYRNDKTGWGTYFGPMYVSSNGDGTGMESPSIKLVTAEMIKYWEKRASEAKNPILKARYAGLVWDFSKKVANVSPSFSIGKLYVEALTRIAEKKLHRYEVDTIHKLERALSLAVAFNQQDLIQRIKKAILDYDKFISSTVTKPGLWGHAYDLLVENNSVTITSEIEKEIIDDLEKKLLTVTESANAKIDPWAGEAAALRLAEYYRKRGKQSEVERVLLTIGKAYDAIVNEAAAMQASGWLEHLHRIYVKYGLKVEAEKLLIKLRELGPKVNEQMGVVPFEFELPKDKMEKYINEILDGNIDTILHRITVQYIPIKEQIKEQIFDLSKQAPLQYIIGHKIQDDRGRVIATVGSLETDLEGHIVRQVSQSLSFSAIFMRMVMSEGIKRHGLSAENIMDFISHSPVINSDRKDIIKRGVDAYFQNDFLVSIHLLIPQIEESIRNIVEYAGGNVLKPAKGGGSYHLRTLDDILRDDIILKSLGEDMTLYFRIMLTDQRGWNMRNNVCHGASGPNAFNQQTADRIIHILLCLGLLRKRENHE